MREQASRPVLRRATLTILCGLVLTGAQLVHGETASSPDAKPTPVHVGTAADYRPLVFKQDRKIAGIEADFVKLLSNDLDVPFEFVELAWTDLVPALRQGRIDLIMSGMSITEERSELVAFTDPYLQTGQMALIHRKDRTRLDDPAALRGGGIRVGVHEKTTGEKFARAELTNATIVPYYGSIDDAIQALRERKIDCVIHDAPTIWRVVGRPGQEDPDLIGLYRPLTDEYLAWAVRKDDDDLRKRLNGALAKWRESGDLEDVLDRWITIRRVSVEIAPK